MDGSRTNLCLKIELSPYMKLKVALAFLCHKKGSEEPASVLTSQAFEKLLERYISAPRARISLSLAQKMYHFIGLRVLSCQ